MIKAAVFDVDGTLLDSMPVWLNAGARYLQRCGIKAEDGLEQKLFTLTMEEGAAYLRRTYGLNRNNAQIIEGINDAVYDFYLHEAPMKPYVKCFLDGLQARGIPMAIATSTDRYLIEAAFERLKIRAYFTEILTCTEIGAGKSKPDIFLRAAELLRAAPAYTWVFEDGLYAAHTAHTAGFKTVGVFDARSSGDRTALKEITDIYLEDFKDFNGFFTEAEQEGHP